jgi:hypothetical protein
MAGRATQDLLDFKVQQGPQVTQDYQVTLGHPVCKALMEQQDLWAPPEEQEQLVEKGPLEHLEI